MEEFQQTTSLEEDILMKGKYRIWISIWYVDRTDDESYNKVI